MITKIIAKLKTGTIKNVIPYGMDSLPAPPYIVVKPIGGNNTRVYEIFVHMKPGQQTFLEDYIFNDLSNLLSDYKTTSRHGNLNKVYDDDQYSDIIKNDDGTISMSRNFIVPLKLF